MNFSIYGSNFGFGNRFGGIDTSSKQYKAAMKMLGAANKGMSMNLSDPHKQMVIKNYMKSFDADGNYIDPTTGIAGMLATGLPVSERHKIISVSEDTRQKMFDETKRHFLEENGNLNGKTTKRSEVFQNYQRSVPTKDRLKGTWTLSQYERQYRQAMIAAVKEADPTWDFGKPIPKGALDNVNHEQIDSAIVSDGTNLSVKRIDFSV